MGKRYRLTDYLWRTRPNDVLNETAAIMDIDKVNTHTVKWFQYRTTAAKNILHRMSITEVEKTRAEADKRADEGWPEEMQNK